MEQAHASPVAREALNRMTGKAYSAQSCPLPSPVATYTYGTTSSGTNYGIGRRVGMTDASGSSSWTYDKMGRIWSETHTIGTPIKTVSNLYNLEGSIQQTIYPTGSGSVIAYTYDNAGHLTMVKDTAHTITYMSAASTNPPAYLAPGQLALATYGSVNETSIFNKRLQPCWFYATTGTQLDPTTPCSGTATAANVLDLKYNFGLGTNDNGNLQSFTNDKDSNRSVTYTYDALNRIASASTPNTDCSLVPGTSLTKNWGESFTVNAWGNLTNRTVTKCSAESLSVVALSSNRLSGFGYDAAGNMTSNGAASYTYNSENQIATTAVITYTYDGDGNRVKKSNGTLYWGAGPLLESDLSGNLQREFTFGGGKRIARRDLPGGAVHYYFTDRLGSSSIVTASAGGIENESDYYPYGGERAYAQTLTNQNYKFTGKERDSESGLDNFGARYDASSLGRFMTPDAFYKDSHVGDPQSWNEYAYVRNNPLRYTDPNGEKATLSTDCRTDQQNRTKCDVTVSASITIYSANGANLTQEQLSAAASTIQSSIQNAWSGSFTQDGVTYNVSTQISVSAAGSEGDAMKSGAQNAIGLSNGPADAAHNADSFVDSRSLFSAITSSGPDTGVFNINSLAGGVAAHEFTHLLGVENKPGGVLSSTNILNDPTVPHSATASDFRWGIREARRKRGQRR